MDHGPLLRASWLRGRLQCPLVVPLKSWWRKRSCHCHPGKATRRGRDLYYNVEHEPARRMPGWPTLRLISMVLLTLFILFIRFYAFWYPFKSRFCWACSVVASFAVVVVVVNHHYSDSSTAIVLYCWCILFLDLHLNELAIQVHLGFDQWSKGVQRCDLLPSGLAAEGGEAILACLAAWLSIRKAQVLLRERGWRWP